MKEIIVPIAILGVLLSLVIPFPPDLVDFLLVGNLSLSLIILISTLYLTNPLKFSALPSLLLLATIYRLSLNISTTRMILGSGQTGHLLEVFGNLVIQGDLIVGAVIFLVITLIQFIVIAKGSERVAEVAARFTLDALPGKQMSIDADMRSGIIDVQTAKKMREELQSESRFYGALDGAMKFIKGDAIAGIVITIVNAIGGFAVGMGMKGLDLSSALSRYTLLTVGDGLLSQIPALLTSLAAGMVVTRVAKEGGGTLAADLIKQIGQIKKVKIIIGIVSLLLAFFLQSYLPFCSIALVLFISAALSPPDEANVVIEEEGAKIFNPKSPALLKIDFGTGLIKSASDAETLTLQIKYFQSEIYKKTGLILLPPEVKFLEELEKNYKIYFRGMLISESAVDENTENIFEKIINELKELVYSLIAEIIDDGQTRRLVDTLDKEMPELVSVVIPEIISITQLTTILRKLIDEEISISNLDLILQAASEFGTKVESERDLYAQVRRNLGRFICNKFANEEKVIKAYELNPIIDMAFSSFEHEGTPVDSKILKVIKEFAESKNQEENLIIICTKTARNLVKETFSMCASSANVIAFEEIVQGYEIEKIGSIDPNDENLLDEVMENAI